MAVINSFKNYKTTFAYKCKNKSFETAKSLFRLLLSKCTVSRRCKIPVKCWNTALGELLF